MSTRFPHLDDTKFPDISNQNVWQYKNNFDYNRWAPDTTIKLCNVNWCGDYDNVVYFETAAKRDSYFDKLPGNETILMNSFRVQPDSSIKLPIPFDAACEYNYIAIRFPRATAPDFPLDNSSPHKERFFYFIDDVQACGDGVTRFSLSLDYWTTYIYDLKFSYVMLERGHAPMKAVSTDKYLSDPINNNKYLLAPDESYGDLSVVASNYTEAWNDSDMWCCIATTYACVPNWDNSDNPGSPGYIAPRIQGDPAPGIVLAFEPEDFESLMNTACEKIPWFFPSIQAVFYVEKDIVTATNEREFCGVTCYLLTASRGTKTIRDLSKSDFDMPAEYAEIAKLYTYPYSEIIVCDEKGNTIEVRVEDTDGTIAISRGVSLVYPFLNIDAEIISAGGKQASLSFRNANTFNMRYGGTWYDKILTWNIPTFAVQQSSYWRSQYANYYNWEQTEYAADQSYTSAKASNTTAQQNAKASNSTANTNSKASNSTAQTNANASATASRTQSTNQINANNSSYNVSRAQQTTGMGNTNENLENNATVAKSQNNNNYAINAQYQQEATNVTNEYTAAAALVGAAATGVSSAIGVGSAISSSDVVGAVSALGQGITSITSNLANANITLMKNSEFVGLVNQQNKGLNNNSIQGIDLTLQNAQSFNADTLELNLDTLEKNNDITNELIDANSQISYNTATANASRTRNTGDANADRSKSTSDANADRSKSTSDANAKRSYDTSIKSIDNAKKQIYLEPSPMYGSTSNGDTRMRPMAMFVNVIRQSDSAISAAGDQMLRYGYMLNQQWKINSFNLMDHFTYWKCSEVWCSGIGNAIEKAQTFVKNILTDGVTVWRDPDEIGAVSIYDNI